jgi:hypothetical protein
MAIEVIKGKVDMPKTTDRRFKYTCNNGNINSYWYVYDSMNNNKRLAKGKFEDMAFHCLVLNKNYYRSLEDELRSLMVKVDYGQPTINELERVDELTRIKYTYKQPK